MFRILQDCFIKFFCVSSVKRRGLECRECAGQPKAHDQQPVLFALSAFRDEAANSLVELSARRVIGRRIGDVPLQSNESFTS
jgi:hypothetical protein